jgi:hypothetical protein
MRILVLTTTSSDPSYQSMTTYLKQIGVPYDVIALNTQTADSAGNRLSGLILSNTTTGEGLYQGIIETDSRFNVCNPSCHSLMSPADWLKLDTYAAQFGVRVATYFTYPDARWGLVPADAGATYTPANPLKVSLTSAGAAVFSYLNPANPIPVAGDGSTNIVAYRATTTTATNETTTPLLIAGNSVVGVTHTTADGRETLSLTFDNYPTLLHSLAFDYGVINWVTRGIFLGSRKMYLNAEIDDMLLGNALYAPSLPNCQQTDTCPTVYTTAQDLTALADWQEGLHQNAQFKSFRGTFAYNGAATTWRDMSDPVFTAIPVLSSNFGWMSHTWSHPNLDCYTTVRGVCQPANLSQSLSELSQNIAIAKTLGFTIDSTGLVTPYNGGLTNLNFLQAAAQVGIRYIITTDNPPSPMTGNVSPLLSSILFVTRRDPNLFYDVSSPLTGVYGSWPDEYNALFGPGGSKPTYSTKQTYSQILDNESDSVLRNNILSYEPYPLAFHVSNTSTYDGTHSLYTDLLDATIAKYSSLCTLPVVTLDMKDIGMLLANRASYNGSGVVGVYTPGVNVVLTTQKAATIPITGACSQSTCGTYGGQMQDNIVMAGNSTITLALTAGEGVAVASVGFDPSTVTGGSSSTGTITLNGPAPNGGIAVALSSNDSAVIVPPSVTVPSGSSTAGFTVQTAAVTSSVSATITASYNGVNKAALLGIMPASVLSAFSVNPTTVTGGNAAAGTVTLSAAAPNGGVSVTLKSSSSSATVPASVTVAAGSTTATFSITTGAVSTATTATITASYNSASKIASLTMTPALTVALSAVSVSPTTVTGGSAASGTVTLSAAAPAGGISVELWTTGTVAFVPTTVTIPAGSRTGTFTVTTVNGTSTSDTITAFYKGATKTAKITVKALLVSSVSVSPTTVTGGNTATGTVSMTVAAPAGGVSVDLWTTGAVAFVPVNITIPAGSTTGTFTVTTNGTSSPLQDTITAFYYGVSKTVKITVAP